MINEFNKVAGHKIGIQKPVAFLYTDNEISKRDCKKIPFKKIPKKKKKKKKRYLVIKLNKEMKDLYTEN